MRVVRFIGGVVHGKNIRPVATESLTIFITQYSIIEYISQSTEIKLTIYVGIANGALKL